MIIKLRNATVNIWNANLAITINTPNNEITTIPDISFLCHINKSTNVITRNDNKNTADRGTNINLQLTVKSAGLCKYISNGVYISSINDDANEIDIIAASFHFGGIHNFNLSRIT